MVFQLDEPTQVRRRVDAADRRGGDADAGDRASTTRSSATSALPRQEKVDMEGRGRRRRSRACSSIRSDYQPGRRYPLVVQLHGGPAESDKFGYGPGRDRELRAGARGQGLRRASGRTIAAAPATATRFSATSSAATSATCTSTSWRASTRLVQRGRRRSRSAGRDGLERRRAPRRTSSITFTDRFKAASSAAGVANWTSLFAQTDTRREPHARGSAARRGSENAPHRCASGTHSPLKDVANVKTPTLLFCGRGAIRACRCRSRSRCTARSSATACRRGCIVAPREGHQWGELRHQLFKANTELEWFERYVHGPRRTSGRSRHETRSGFCRQSSAI